MSEPNTTPIPRRGRGFVILAFLLGLIALGYALVELSTREPGRELIEVKGGGDAQRIFGGIHQEGDRLGAGNAPVSIQVFADMQCGNCREDFIVLIPALAERYAREGKAKMLMRHLSIARNELELGFFGAEAAAQQGYGWQYTYLFFRNQDEAERFGIDERFLETIAGSISDLNVPEWSEYLEEEGNTGGAIEASLDRQSELAEELGIRANVAILVSGPKGTRLLQDGPSPAAAERAIAEVG